jgi:hypothetical protein
MDPRNFFVINFFVIACINFSRTLNPETLTRVIGQTLPGSQIFFF